MGRFSLSHELNVYTTSHAIAETIDAFFVQVRSDLFVFPEATPCIKVTLGTLPDLALRDFCYSQHLSATLSSSSSTKTGLCVAVTRHGLSLRWGCREHFVSGCWHSSGRDRGRYPRECWLSTLGVLHPGVPVMWYGHTRDLFPTAEGCKGSRLPNVARLHWAYVSTGVRQ